MTDDLITFLLARLDEEAALAGACDTGPWDWTDRGHSAQLKGGEPDYPLILDVDQGMKRADEWGITDSPNLQHIARHDPARVLAEVEAKRRLLNDLVSGWEDDDPGRIERHLLQHRGPSVLIDPETGDEEIYKEWTVTRYLRLLAQPYVDHSDFKETWRP